MRGKETTQSALTGEAKKNKIIIIITTEDMDLARYPEARLRVYTKEVIRR